MREVGVRALPLSRLFGEISSRRAELLERRADEMSRRLAGRTVWNVNSTEQGGGVAELLQVMVAYGLDVGIRIRWMVLSGDAQFFATTKRLHNLLHGSVSGVDGVAAEDMEHYDSVLSRNVASLVGRIREGDIVVLHDPQTAGMVSALVEQGARVVWRCHIGADHGDRHTQLGWQILRPLIADADAWVFSRRAYAPTWLPADRVWVIAPSVDPFSPKNAALAPREVSTVLGEAGLVGNARGCASFTRRDGSVGTVRAHHGLLLDESMPLPADADLVLQVSRWDRLKGMVGVLDGFTANVNLFPANAHLLLAGPDVSGVTDDPEGAAVLRECRERRGRLAASLRARTHLCCLPMDDVDQNAHIVNALQRRAAVVVQKSLVEGFGLTATEAMWKGRPVVASAVGGLADQIEDGVSGILLDDPTDLDRCAYLLSELLRQPILAARLGAAAHARVVDRFLGDRHLVQFGDLFESLLLPPRR